MGAEWALEAEHPNVRGPGATCPPWAAPLGQGSSLMQLGNRRLLPLVKSTY